MRDLTLIAIGGMLGALARHGANIAAAKWLGAGFPWGTLTVNVVGCFVIGIAGQTLAGLDAKSPPEGTLDAARATLKYGLSIGFLGALTTFSSFGLETFKLAEANRWDLAAANVLLNLLAGFAAVLAGIAVVRALA